MTSPSTSSRNNSFFGGGAISEQQHHEDAPHGSNNPMDTSHDTTLSIFQESSNQAWEAEILKHTQARRNRQETTLSSLHIQLQRLQAALARESKRRVESIDAVQKSCQHRIQNLEDQLTTRIDEQHQSTVHTLELLENRIAELEARWERQVGDVEGHIDATESRLVSQLDELKQTIEQESRAAKERHDSQTQQVERLSKLYDDQWKHERQERLSSLHALTDRINSQDDVAQQHVDHLQARIGQELQLLHDELQQEAQERQQGDEEIVDALNRYMAQIQKSLQYL